MRIRPAVATLTAAMGAVALVATGCGSSGSSGLATPVPTTALTSTPLAPPVTAPPPPSTSPTAAPASAASQVPAAPEVNPAGDIPDNQAFVPWSPATGIYTVSVPEGWARSDNGTSTAFTDKLNSITVTSTSQPTAPSAATERAVVSAAFGAAPGFAMTDATAVSRAAGKAVLVTYAIDAPADPVTGKVVADAAERYTFWRNGTAVTLTLAGPKGADNVDPWRIVTDSFAWHA